MVEVQYPQIEGYEFLSILGEGGMGRVYRALRKSDGRQVAVKVIHPSFYEGEYEDCLERFRREIEVSKNLSHPSIVLVLDGGWGKADNNPFIVMELLEGLSCSRKLV